MGIFTYTDPQTKRVYNFEHPGDAPEEQDFAFMRDYVAKERDDYTQRYMQAFGEQPAFEDGTAIGRGWDRGVEDVRGGIGELLQTLGQRTGWGGLADYGSGMEQNAVRNLGEMNITAPEAMSWRDVQGLGSGLTYLGELAGSSAPVMLGGAAGALAGVAAAPAAIPGVIAGGIGATLATAPYYTGSILQGQERVSGEDNVSLGKAALGGTVAAALDSASLVLLGKLGVGKAAIDAFSGEVGRGLTARILTGAGAGAATEGTTEALQEVTQMLAEGVDPASPEVQTRLLDAFIGGGVLGGAIGGAGRGAFGKRPETPAPTPEAKPTPEAEKKTDLLALPAPEKTLGLPAPATRLGLAAPENLTLGLPVPGRAESRPASETGATVIPPVQPGQSRMAGSHVPNLNPEAVAVANGLGSDPQLLAAAQAIEDAGKATVDVIQKSLGLSYPAARGLMVKLEGMGAVSKFAPNRPRTLTLPFKVSALQNEAADRIRAQGEAASADMAAKAAATMAQTTQTEAEIKAAKVKATQVKTETAAKTAAATDVGVDETLMTDAQRAAQDVAAAQESAARDAEAAATQEAEAAKATALKAGLDAMKATGKATVAKAKKVAKEAAPGIAPEVPASEAATPMAPEEAVAVRRFLDEEYPGFFPADFEPGATEQAAKAELDRAYAAYDQKYLLRDDEVGPAHRRVPSSKWRGMTSYEGVTDGTAEGKAIETAFIKHRDAKARRDDKLNSLAYMLKQRFPDRAADIDADPLAFVKAALSEDSIPRIEEMFRPSADRDTSPRGNADIIPLRPAQAQAQPEAAPADFNRDAIPGRQTGTATQIIPQPNIRPVQGKQLEAQAAAQRDSIARQLSTKAKLEDTMQGLRARIGTGTRLPDSLRAEAKKLGVKAADHKKALQRELRRLQAQHYAITSYVNSEAGRAQAQSEGNTNQENIRRRAENDAARTSYRAWYTDNTPAEIQAYDADIRGEGLKVAPVIMPETGVAQAMDPKARAQVLAQEAAAIDALDPTTVEDKAKLLDLLKKGVRRLPGKVNENARAAHAYFSKSRDIADALDNIAADAAMPDVPGKRVGSNRETLHPYWKGTGKDAAMKAAQWVEDNLSEDALGYMDEQIGRYAEDTAEAAGNVIDRQINNTRANAEADEKTLGEYYKAMGAIDNSDVSQELGIESGVFNRESLRTLRTRALGADHDLIGEIGIDIGQGILFNKPRSIAFGLEAPLHPSITKALRNGNLKRALEGLSATTTDPYISELARKLISFVGDTKVYTTRSGSAASQAEVLRVLTDAATGEVHPGAYMLMSEENFGEVAATSGQYATAIQNAIFLDEATGMNAHTILHEVLHPATLKELTQNPNGPVARRLEELRQLVFDAIGKEFQDRGEVVPYGLTDVKEFVTEALSNQSFQGILDRFYPTTKKVTALEQLLRTISNFVRTRILGKPAKVYNDNRLTPSRMVPDTDSVFDEVDRLVRSIFNTAPEFNIYDALYDTARRPEAAAQALDNAVLRLRSFKTADAVKMDNAVSATAAGFVKAEAGTMPTILNLFTPVRNLVDLASKYFPEAARVYENLTKNNQYKQELSKEMWNTLKRSYTWLDAHPQLEQRFHSLRTRASKQEIDPRFPASYYDSYVVRYYKYRPDGTVGEAKYTQFKDASSARDFITKINDAEAKGAATTKAKLLFSPDRENIALHKKLSAELADLEAQAPGARKAYTDYLNIAERLHREAGKALKQRLEALYPGRENAYTRNAMLRGQYNKIFAERGLLAYQPLQRKGDFRISYSGVHPDTNTVEPFVHYFGSLEEAQKAKQALLALPPEYKIKEANTVNGVPGAAITISPRGINDAYAKHQVPPTFVTDVVNQLRASAIKDADAAQRRALSEGKTKDEAAAERARVYKMLNDNAQANADKIVQIALNTLPESSIFSTYRARTGVSGFKGDLSPLKVAFDKLERDFDTPDVSRGLFENFMDSMVQKIGAIHQQADADLVRAYLNGRMEELGADLGNGKLSERDYNKAVTYYRTLTTALNNPSIRRMQLATNVNTGAYMFTLLGNASSAVMNIMGAVTFVYPRLAARYGSVKAAKMMLKSIRTIANSGRTRLEPIIGPKGETIYEEVDAGIFGRSLRNYKFSGVDHTKGFNKGDNANNALEYLVREGERRHMLIDSLIYDYLDANKTSSEMLNKIVHWGSAPLHHIERTVRESAMLANYDLELRRMADAKGSDVLTQAEMEEAARTAVQQAELMTGTIPSTAAPNWAQRGIMPSIAMYKRYPLAMIHMIVGDFANAIPSKAKLAETYGADTEAFRNALMERKIARWQVASVMGSMALFAGAMGMPFYGMIADIWDLAFTDEDEEDFDTLVRMGIGEFGSKGILNYLFGVEFSSRIGLGDMLYRTPLRAEDQPPIWNLIEGFGGPALSLAHGLSTRTVDLYQQGEYYRALESAMPAAMRNIMRAGRFTSEGGALSLRDDIISDISPGEALAQALGFAPSSYIRQVELNSAVKRMDAGRDARKTRITRRINLALRNGDSAEYAAAMAEREEFNRDHPTKPITGETLKRSRKTFARTSERVRNGVVLSDPQDYDLKDVMALMEEPATIWDQLSE